MEETAQDETTNGVEAEAADQAAPQRDLAAEYLDALQRERANFINYRRRIDQEKPSRPSTPPSTWSKSSCPWWTTSTAHSRPYPNRSASITNGSTASS